MRAKSLFLFALIFLSVTTTSLYSQGTAEAMPTPMSDPNEGIWKGYDGELRYVTRLLVSLAEAIPAEKYAWRPAPGVRSVSEVYMHIVIANYYLLTPMGSKMPAELMAPGAEAKIASKVEVIDWLKRSLEAVKTGRMGLKPGELARKVNIEGESADVDGMYLRIICHNNEHLGQLIAYARSNGVVPPWSAAGSAKP
ncbi:DinB family protein [Granulicella sibirica]|uniref:DinB-like domain-containing protein n=1 Tax=Granulicella sibirica TaxID=2479048 RepID=A0A4V1L605_9BACT|nr:DinB family protein [Granulicella sibirica]RXH57584.1 hypothetical protein GRAN_0894 [Granulicella sibirica]